MTPADFCDKHDAPPVADDDYHEKWRVLRQLYTEQSELTTKIVAERDKALADLAAERDAKYRAMTCAADYAEEVAQLKAELSAMTERTEKAELERDHLRRDLCEIADGCGVGVPDQEEAKRRIIALRIDLDAARAENAKLRALLKEAKPMTYGLASPSFLQRIDLAEGEGK